LNQALSLASQERGFLLSDFARQISQFAFVERHIQTRKLLPMKYILCGAFLSCLAGCGVISAESIYEGIRSQQKINADPNIPNPPILPPYDQYQKEREKPTSTPPSSAAP
jgi:hypothetical protein